MSSNIAEASPTKAVVAELENLHLELRNEAARYVTRLDSEIERVRLAVEAGSSAKSLSSQRIRDLRDMLTILRQGQTKGDKGRRKNLKKIESVVGDLGMLIEKW